MYHVQRKGRVMEKNNGKRIRTLIVFAAAVIMVAVMAVMFLIVRYTPTKNKMSGYSYFDIDKDTDKVLVIIDGQNYPDTGMYIDDRLYIPQSFIENNVNVRFYYDREAQSLIYTDPSHVYTFASGSNEYYDDRNESYKTDYPVSQNVEGECYVAWEYVADYTNCTYEYGDEPKRVNITLSHDAVSCVTAEKKVSVRYRGGIKSPVLEVVKKGTRLEFLDDLDDWIQVMTPTGITGYVKKSEVSDIFEFVQEDTFSDNYNANLKSGKVTLAWFQVGGTGGNAYVDNYLAGTSGINVISPTWYSITGTDGAMTSYGSKDFVNKMHSRGIDVWVLVDDFDTNVDYAQLYSSKKARTRMINTLISDAAQYGYDGINLDLENVKSTFAKDFLQFVRELSVECNRAGLVLSTDNYKPEVYNTCYNLKEQAVFVDYVIVMAYDEHHAGSDAGSVASLPFVKEAVEDTVELVPKEQVIVGIPFYTRVWTTTGGQTTSKAVSMQTAIDQLNSDGQVALWNDDCGQYVASYTVGSSTRQIWFEEEKSLEAKLKVIQENNVAGVAGWKLGLEKSTVWPVISQYNK